LLQIFNPTEMPAKINRFKDEKLEQKAKKKGDKKKKTFKNPFTRIISFFKNKQFHHILGLFLILFSIFLSLSFSSYLSTWKADDTIFSRDFIDLMVDNSIKAENMMGKIGAIVANIFIKEGFGISAYFFIIFFFVAGVNLLWKKAPISGWKTFQICLLGLVLLSTTLAWMLPFLNDKLLPGWFGIYVNNWLESVLGRPGAGLLLLFVILSFLVIVGFFAFVKINMPSFPAKSGDGKTESEKKKKNNGTEPDEDRYNTHEYHVKDDEDDDDDFFADKKPAEKKAVQTWPKQDKPKEEKPKQVVLSPTISKIQPNREKPKRTDDVDFTIENIDEKVVERYDEVITPTPAITPKTEPEKRFTIDSGDYDPRLDLPHYRMPSIELLNDYGSDRINVQKDELENNKNRIVETLNHYQIQIQKIKATIGPTVTLYEIIPAPGIRISKIKNLEDDIALSLSAFGIRIIAPIPGKGTIGIEVPNQNPDIVSMKSVLGSDRFVNSKYDLPFGLGKTISNEVFVADLTKMPHILMAGATGQGKSVGLNAIIASFLYTKHPSELKFVMVDPKKVELTLFSKIERHYLAKLPDSEEAIITDTRKVVRTLNSLGIEMDTRYELLKDAQVRNIKEYNTKFISRKLNPTQGHHFLPYIVVVIDEFADLIMTAGKEIEIPLTRLAQLARAVGIHLIIATQRPSVNIITGSIKANFPARAAFRVISKIDSRTILDTQGADQLIGRGDMLFSTGSDLIRLQCGFIDTPEIDKLTDFIGSQRAYPNAYHLPEFSDENDEPITEFNPDERDPLFEDAARIIVQNQQGSTSLLQRKMKIGYNRAGRIIDQLEAAGIVGPFEGSKAREVLIHTEIELEQFLNDMNL